MSTPLTPLGLDIAKETFEAELLCDEHSQKGHFENTPAGYKKLSAWLKKHHQEHVHACMEATGRYGEDLALYLHEHGHVVSIVNPSKIHFYAKSKLSRNKTDRVDAHIIAIYCEREKPRAWAPPPPEVLKLQQLVRLVDTVKQQRVQCLNRLSSEPPFAETRQVVQEQLDLFNRQIKAILKDIHTHLEAYPNLRHGRDLLRSTKGIGVITAAHLLAVNLPAFESARAASAYAGLSPYVGESGKSVHHKSKLCKIGNPELRRALYMPALSAIRHNPLVKALVDRMAKAGKCKMVQVAAAMHKLIVVAFGVLKSDMPFDPKYHANRHFAS